jgi:hypothetical protein
MGTEALGRSLIQDCSATACQSTSLPSAVSCGARHARRVDAEAAAPTAD